MPIRPSETPLARLNQWQERRKQVGSRIRELRIAQELTQEALGLEAGLSRVMIIGIEWGKKSLAYERLWDLADVLGVDISDLFSPASSTPAVEPHRRGRVRSNTRNRSSTAPDGK
ncbi:helix-turn-helix transcriptional regulator [Arthrobacter sp. efr-133-TYG-120]|uniref:helix-turn-helix domain-containing protein n=1 Tax=Arthrobacter sp. efr-133-TYG-120 TaxID=3040280 RepID=UPI0033056895